MPSTCFRNKLYKCISYNKKWIQRHVLERKNRFANLVTENDVSQTKVDQEKRKYQWSKDEVCYTEKTKETNPRDFTVIRKWWGLKIVITVSTKNSTYKIVNKLSQLKEFWCYSSPSRCHNICYKERCLYQIHKILKFMPSNLWNNV